MQVSFPDLIRENIKKIIDEISELTEKKKSLVLEYIKPIEDEIDVLKTKILSEWKLDKTEKQFYGTAPAWLKPEDAPHATISQSVKIEVDYKQIVTDHLADPENFVVLSDKLGMTEDEFRKKYVKENKSKPSVRVYT